MTKIKVVKKKKKVEFRYSKNQGYRAKLNKGVTKIEVSRKKLNKIMTKIKVIKKKIEDSYKKLRLSRKIKQRYDKNRGC